MARADCTPSPPELRESASELLTRLQGLKQNWISNLATHVNTYRDELSALKRTVSVVGDELRSEFQELKTTLQSEFQELKTTLQSEFQELKTTLQQQQDDVTATLKNIGDHMEDAKEMQNTKVEANAEG